MNSIGHKMQRAHDKLVIFILLYKFESISSVSLIKKLSSSELSSLVTMYQDRKEEVMTEEEVLAEVL